MYDLHRVLDYSLCLWRMHVELFWCIKTSHIGSLHQSEFHCHWSQSVITGQSVSQLLPLTANRRCNSWQSTQPTMYTTVLSVLAFLAIISAVSMAPSDYKNNVKLFRETQAKSSDFKCKHPQPKAVLISEVLGDKYQTDKIYMPYMTVLHRCNSTGCCQPGFSCQPETFEIVKIGVKMESVISSRKKPSYLPVNALNHTSCACMDVGNIPK